MDAGSEWIIWVEANRNHGTLFIALLKKLDRVCNDKKMIHVILDNSVIHSSRITKRAVGGFEGRIVLHFLPPYCPDDHRIERCVGRGPHANVPWNHRGRTTSERTYEGSAYRVARSRKLAARRRHAARNHGRNREKAFRRRAARCLERGDRREVIR